MKIIFRFVLKSETFHYSQFVKLFSGILFNTHLNQHFSVCLLFFFLNTLGTMISFDSVITPHMSKSPFFPDPQAFYVYTASLKRNYLSLV